MYLAAVLIALVIGFLAYSYWKYKAANFGAPFVGLEEDLVDRVLQIAEVKPEDTLYDLGSGEGRIVIMAALRYGAKGVGIEIDKLRYYYSKVRASILRVNDLVHFINDSFANVSVSEASVVTVFLLKETNDIIREKLERELKPGTRVVSAAFEFADWKPVYVDHEHQTPYGPLYLYVIGVSNKTQGNS